MIFNCDKFLSDVSLTVSWFPGGEKNRDWAEAEIEKTRENCDFCKPNQFTVRLFNGNDDENDKDKGKDNAHEKRA